MMRAILTYFLLFLNLLGACENLISETSCEESGYCLWDLDQNVCEEPYFGISLSTLNDRLLVNTNTNYDIYGYQFQITNISLTDCISPSESDFFITVGSNGIVGFSLLGSVIPSGENTILSCLIIDNEATQQEEDFGCCLEPNSIIINNGSSNGGYTPSIPQSEIVIGDCIYLDCFDQFNGDALVDDCGVCNGGNANQDCNGECFGSSILDCEGVCDGLAEIDGCGRCVGGNTGLVPCVNDCSGNIGGSATYNECETCICNGMIAQNGYICIDLEPECIQGCDGSWENDGTQLLIDECGVCDGDSTTCLDCAGVPNGMSEIDCLGICGDPSSDNFAIEDLCGNCLGSCISPPVIDCDCETANINGWETIICTGDCNPESYTSPCFVWNSETWVDAPGGTPLLYEEGDELNDLNNNGLADRGCYDCGGNTYGDDNYEQGNIFRKYPDMNSDIYSTQFYCSALIDNNNINDDGFYVNYLSNYDAEIGSDFSLLSTYPNPFNPITTISYSVKNAGNVKIDVYNILGEHIYTLIDAYHAPASLYKISWNSKSQFNRPISSGIYFIKVQYSNNVLIQKLTLIK